LFVDAAKPQIHPTAASLSFLIRRCVIDMDRPEARVTGADPA
jgi:hypothetical protein